MADLRETVASCMAARYTKLAAVVRELAAPLSDEQFWTKPLRVRQQLRPPGAASHGQLELLHRGADCGDGVCARPSAGVFRTRRAIERRSDEELRRRGGDGGADDSGASRQRNGRPAYTADGLATAEDPARNGAASARLILHHHIGQMMYLGFELKRKG